MEYACDVRMTRGGSGACLAQEAFARHLGARTGRGEIDHFQGNVPVQNLIPRTKSHPHRTTAQFPGFPVIAARDSKIAKD